MPNNETTTTLITVVECDGIQFIERVSKTLASYLVSKGVAEYTPVYVEYCTYHETVHDDMSVSGVCRLEKRQAAL